MEKLSVEVIIDKIKQQQPFHAVAEDYSFTIKIEDYVPYVCAAIHDGHQFRKELWDNCLHTEYDRWYEEDPETKNMISSHPIVIAGCDSRFEYDLNRPPEEAVFETAWGKQLWKTPLPEAQKQASLAKHKAFYDVVHALIETIESKYGVAIVYDMHSYNWKRWDREVPTWNLGTTNVDNERFGDDIETWRQSLSELNLPNNIKSTALINDTFFGNGYFLKFITNSFKNTLVLATEIAKVYCDEYEQVNFPEVVSSVESQLRERLPKHAKTFMEKHSKQIT
ncbi:N-formylglutamate amidohydrolase [Flavobacteriaceae bacterium S0825]|uniref:N-formylglutamate amidohydrolase n=1 Tax=Gaetbulibacter sp. S0825 TaxID=2720084 RepID=UPI001432130A|nr:N-formylglutamate amidohydrolase [Gaetbulibacter sp. S0825]MCK0109804.1 N-formylglutamate amidohydrolase [Flavobacteriaceae bacterium S0825]NIX65433.1 N-formylglutamate amidohydrolase [Gaetbulibacter sp. S0825]